MSVNLRDVIPPPEQQRVLRAVIEVWRRGEEPTRENLRAELARIEEEHARFDRYAERQADQRWRQREAAMGERTEPSAEKLATQRTVRERPAGLVRSRFNREADYLPAPELRWH